MYNDTKKNLDSTPMFLAAINYWDLCSDLWYKKVYTEAHDMCVNSVINLQASNYILLYRKKGKLRFV